MFIIDIGNISASVFLRLYNVLVDFFEGFRMCRRLVSQSKARSDWFPGSEVIDNRPDHAQASNTDSYQMTNMRYYVKYKVET